MLHFFIYTRCAWDRPRNQICTVHVLITRYDPKPMCMYCSRAMTSILCACAVHVLFMRYDVIVGIPLFAIWGGVIYSETFSKCQQNYKVTEIYTHMQFITRTSRFDASYTAKIQLTKSSCLRSHFDSFFLTNNYIFLLYLPSFEKFCS